MIADTGAPDTVVEENILKPKWTPIQIRPFLISKAIKVILVELVMDPSATNRPVIKDSDPLAKYSNNESSQEATTSKLQQRRLNL